jgi:hypothetical protein
MIVKRLTKNWYLPCPGCWNILVVRDIALRKLLYPISINTLVKIGDIPKKRVGLG